MSVTYCIMPSTELLSAGFDRTVERANGTGYSRIIPQRIKYDVGADSVITNHVIAT